MFPYNFRYKKHNYIHNFLGMCQYNWYSHLDKILYIRFYMYYHKKSHRYLYNCYNKSLCKQHHMFLYR